MRNFIMICFLFVFGYSCNTRDEFFDSLNKNPELEMITATGKVGRDLTDSLKMSGEYGLFFYDLKLVVSDINENIEGLTLNEPFLPGLYIQNDTVLVDVELINVTKGVKDTLDVRIAIFQEGRQDVVFTLRDSFDQSVSAQLSVDVFENLSPVVNYEADESDLNDLVWEINLAESFDNDAAFGGEIISYTVIIEGQVNTKDNPLFRHTFSREGSYPISVYVTDNNEQQSLVKFFSIDL